MSRSFLRRLVPLWLLAFTPADAQNAAPPVVEAVAIADGQAQRSLVKSLSVTYLEPLAAPVRASDLVLHNLTHDLEIPAETQAFSYNPGTRTARFTFTIHGGALPQGNYLARIRAPFDPATALACHAASPLPPDHVFGFHVLFGDMNGDRDVDYHDTAFLWKSWDLAASAPDFDEALDFNFDGKVDAADRAIFAWNYFTIFPPAPALHAELLNDSGASPRDGITADPSIAGTLLEPAAVAALRGRFASGSAEFTDLTGLLESDGSFVIPAELLPAVFGDTLPYAGLALHLQALDAAGEIVCERTVPFHHTAAASCGTISGRIFEDPAGDGSGTQPLAGRIVYIDSNENGVRDEGERFVLSDHEGNYRFDQLPNGRYFIYQELPEAWEQTAPRSLATGGGDGWADFVVEYHAAGNGPAHLTEPYGRPFGGATNQPVDPADIILGPTPPGSHDSRFGPVDFLSIPMGSSVTVGFTDEMIVDGPGDDIFIHTIVDHASERANIYVGSNPDEMVFLKQIGQGGSAGVDLADIGYQGNVRFVKIEGVDNRGSAPGFDLIAVSALSRIDVVQSFHFVELSDAENQRTGIDFGSRGWDDFPSVAISTEGSQIAVGETYRVKVTARDDIAVVSVQLSVNGIPVTLDESHTYSAVAEQEGLLILEAVATDSANQSSTAVASLHVFGPDGEEPGSGSPPEPDDDIGPPTGDPEDRPFILIASPAQQDTVSYLTPIVGTVTSPSDTLHSWRVEYAPASQVNLHYLGAPGPDWQVIASGTEPVTDGALATFDPTLLRNDPYVIRVVAFNTNGRGWAEPLPLSVAGQAKLGNFRLDFTDLQIPLAGIPITITRSYDTLDAGRSGDFGHGWTLGLQDADVRESTPGTGGVFTANPYRQGTRVYLTTPEGRRVGFTFEAVPAASSLFGSVYRAVFTPDPGVYETLTIPEGDGAFLNLRSDGTVGLFMFGLNWNPDEFILTDRSGTRWHYHQTAGLRKAEDLNGHTLTFTAGGVRHSSGVEISFIRDGQGRITEIREPGGLILQYAYSPEGDLSSFTDEAGLVTTFAYHPERAHYLDTITDPLGRQAVRTEYGDDGRITAIIDALGNRSERNFDPANFTGSLTDARGNVTTLVYNARGNIVEEHKSEGGVTAYEYADPANPDKETAITDPLGNRRTFAYDARGNTLSQTDPAGTSAEHTYNTLNLIVSTIRRDQAGDTLSTESAEYDAAGNLTRRIDPLGNHRDFAYDDQGRLIHATDFEGNLTTYDYTDGCACGQPSKIIHPDGSESRYEFDRFGRITRITDQTGATMRVEYDARGNRTREIDHDDNAIIFEYDDAGNLVRRTDRLGHITKFAYDDKNQLVETLRILSDDGDDTNDIVERYEYDEAGNQIAIVDPTGNRTEFTFDGDNRMTARKDAAGALTAIAYDAAGNVSEITDRNDLKRSFLHNARNQITAERWHDASDAVIRTIATTYDDLGRRTSLADPDSALAWQYDAAGRILEESNAGTPGLPPLTLTYGHDKDGRIVSTTGSDGVSVLTARDNRGLSARFLWSGGGISSAGVELDRNGRDQITLIKRYADATLQNLVSQTSHGQIAPQGWIGEIRHMRADGELYHPDALFTWQYDAQGQVTNQSSLGNTTSYTYDPAGQLLSATHTTHPGETYTYDPGGNRSSHHTGPANRLLDDGSFTYTHDAEGNIVTRTETATGGVTEFAYDHRGRLNSVTTRASAGGEITGQLGFTYDALNRRIRIDTGASATFTAYHQDNAWADYDASGAVTARYLFADRSDGNLAKWTPGDGTQWYLTDTLNSIRGLVSAEGFFQGGATYDSFGNLLSGDAPLAAERYGFTGREHDAPGFVYYRSRHYSPTIGRFLGEDRIGFQGGDLNLYRYVNNSPLNFTDPSGRVAAVEYFKIGVDMTNTIVTAFCTGNSTAGAFQKTMIEVIKGLYGLEVNAEIYKAYGPGGGGGDGGGGGGGGAADVILPLIPYGCLLVQ